MEKRWTIKEILAVASQYLTEKGIESPRLAAEVLLAHVLGMERIGLYLDFDRPLVPAEVSRFRELIRRRVAREPLQYITGLQEFWSLEFQVGPQVLIPRPETELLVEQAIRQCKDLSEAGMQEINVLDLCTGCGAVAVCIAKEVGFARLWASDVSPGAIAVAKINAQRHGVADRIRFIEGDLFEPLKDKEIHFHIIVSNPPYVAQEDYDKLPPEIKDFEPRLSLDGGPGGMAVIERILREAPEFLTSTGVVMIEMDPGQIHRAMDVARSLPGFERAEVVKDYSGRERVIIVMVNSSAVQDRRTPKRAT